MRRKRVATSAAEVNMTSPVPPPNAVIDADLAGRMNTRLMLGALAEVTGTTLVLGPLAKAEVEPVLDRIAWKSGRVMQAHEDYRIWEETLAKTGVVRVLTREELIRHRRRNPGIHKWLERTWAKLNGDPNDEDHVAAGIVTGAEAVLTGNMTCIDGKALAREAAKDGLQIPKVTKQDECLDYFGTKIGDSLTHAEVIEAAVLPAASNHHDFIRMWTRFLPKIQASFPKGAGRLATEVRARTHDYYLRKAEGMTPTPATRQIVERTVLAR